MKRLVAALALAAAPFAIAQDPAPAQTPAAAEPAAAPPAAPLAEAEPDAPAKAEPAAAKADEKAPAPGEPAAPTPPAKPAPIAAPAKATAEGQTEPARAKAEPKAKPKPAPAPAPAAAAAETRNLQDLIREAEGAAAAHADHGSHVERPSVPLTETQEVELVARNFFLHLAAGDARNLVDDCAFPFSLEDRRFTEPDALFREWLNQVRAKRVDLLVLYGIEVFTPKEMEAKHGAPPARLTNFPWKGPKTWITVANLSGRPAVAVVKQITPSDFRVVAYTD